MFAQGFSTLKQADVCLFGLPRAWNKKNLVASRWTGGFLLQPYSLGKVFGSPSLLCQLFTAASLHLSLRQSLE